MLDLLLTILCTSSNSIIIKVAETRIRNRIAMLFMNYVIASSVALVTSLHLEPGGFSKLSNLSIILGIIGGCLFAANFLLYCAAIQQRGVALPASLMRLGAVVPLIVSIIFFSESPSTLQIIGIIGALSSAVMLSLGIVGGKAQNSQPAGSGHTRGNESAVLLALWALGLLLSFSLPDLVNKLFEQLGEPVYKSSFLAIIFTCAGIFIGIVVIMYKVKFHPVDLFWGAILGIPNLFASYFLVSALTKLPAYIVFPVTSSGSVLLVSLIAVIIFRENMRAVGIIAIFLTVMSLILINI